MNILKRGFTLIELLVVISIISLLSTVIMAQVQQSRIKAENAQITQNVRTWITALERYKIDNGLYWGEAESGGSDGSPLYYDCLGYPCSGAANHNPDFKNAMDKYIAYKNPNQKPIKTYNGQQNTAFIQIQNDDYVHVVTLVYYLSGNANCLPTASKSYSESSSYNTRCDYRFVYKEWPYN
ncbi:MAG: type II secretion system protein [Candidatus Shapirobacteria bacterium]